MYQRITDEDPYQLPMRIYPAVHYTMGGLWVDYNLMSTIPGLHVIGEANFSDHGANRLGASALMQGLADGYFILPNTIGDYLAATKLEKVETGHPDVPRGRGGGAHAQPAPARHQGEAHRRLVPPGAGQAHVGQVRHGAQRGRAQRGAGTDPRAAGGVLADVNVPGSDVELNQSLEKAGRVADFLELGELMCRDALHREESCGGHFREEYQTEDGEALRDDERFAYVAAWEYGGDGIEPRLHKEPLDFEYVHLAQRSYK